jgi:hypothetical protein
MVARSDLDGKWTASITHDCIEHQFFKIDPVSATNATPTTPPRGWLFVTQGSMMPTEVVVVLLTVPCSRSQQKTEETMLGS